MRKRIFSIIFILILIITLSMNSYALKKTVTDDMTYAADVLNELGLFKGTQVGYELERAATRTEAVVMLLRLLGEESAALEYNGTHPFTDVEQWASRYIAYAYDRGLISGTEKTIFGANDMCTHQQYSAFLLRALGYSEKAGDFTYDEAINSAAYLGMCDIVEMTQFSRGNLVEMSVYSFFVPTKSGIEFYKLLIEKGVMSPDFETESIQNTKPNTKPNTDPINTSEFEQQVLILTNEYRVSNELAVLTWNNDYAGVARAHSKDMAINDYFDHINLQGQDSGDRIVAAGFDWTGYGENIACGQQTPEEVVNAWFNSPGHRTNMLNGDFTSLGVGLYVSKTGIHYWTQLFCN